LPVFVAMASTLSQAKELFKNIDPDNSGVISRDDLKILMQEIGGEMWAGDNFDSMLEACGIAPGVAEVKYEGFLDQLLGEEQEEKKTEVAKDEAPREEEVVKDEEAVLAAVADSATPSAEDLAEAQTIVESVCARIVASMNVADAKPEVSASDSPKADASAGDLPKPEQESKQEEVASANPEASSGDSPKVDDSAAEPQKPQEEESKQEEVKSETKLEEEAPSGSSPKVADSAGDPPRVEEQSKREEVKSESKLEDEAPAAAA